MRNNKRWKWLENIEIQGRLKLLDERTGIKFTAIWLLFFNDFDTFCDVGESNFNNNKI